MKWENKIKKWMNQGLILLLIFSLMSGCVPSGPSSLDLDGDSPSTPNVPVEVDEFQGIETGNPGSLKGVVQKGPFIKGSSVTVHPLNDGLYQTGAAYYTTTKDDLGSFALSGIVLEGAVEVVAEGYYFNEYTGQTSDSYMTLRALADTSDGAQVNVNVLTTLTGKRIRFLVNNQGSSFQSAMVQAEHELLQGLFHILDPVDSAIGLNILGSDDGHAVLLAVSLIVQSNMEIADLTKFMSDIEDDLADNGIIDELSLEDQIRENATRLHVPTINDYMVSYFDLSLPNFVPYMDNDGDGLINKEDSSCENSEWNSFYNNELSVTSKNFIDADVTPTIDNDELKTIYSVQDSDISITDIDNSWLIIKDANTVSLTDVSSSHSYIAADTIVIDGSFGGSYVIAEGSHATVKGGGWAKYIVLDGATLDITDSPQALQVYVYDGGTLIDDEHTGDLVYYQTGAIVPNYNDLQIVAAPFAKPKDTYISLDATASLADLVIDQMGVEVPGYSERFDSYDQMRSFKPFIDIDVSDASCVYNFQEVEISNPVENKHYVERGAIMNFKQAKNQKIYLQAGASMMIEDSTSVEIFAQAESTVQVLNGNSDLTIHYEEGANILDSGDADLDLTAFITFQ